MRLFSIAIRGLLVLAGGLAFAAAQQPLPTPNTLLFEGSRLIVGDGSAPIEDSAFLVENNRFTRIGKKGSLQAPAGAVRIDLTGKTVMPAIVDAHTHLGYTIVKTNRTEKETYTRENLVDHLRRLAYYGVAATLSMGVDRGDIPFQVRGTDSRCGVVSHRRPRHRFAGDGARSRISKGCRIRCNE